MPISVTCPNCQAAYRVADEMAGKKLKCQKCAGVIAVPANETPVPPTVETEKPAKLTQIQNAKAGSASSLKKPTPAKKNTAARKAADPDEMPPKKAKAGGRSGLMTALIFFLGVGLLGCLGCAGAVGWWFYETANDLKAELKKAELKAIAAADKAQDKKKIDKGAKDKKKTDAVKDKEVALIDGKKDGAAKDGATLDGKKDASKKDDGGKGKTPPPIDVKKDDPVKEKKETPFVAPPPPPGVIAVDFGPDGVYRSDNVLTEKDPVNQIGRTYKAYQVVMQAGQYYQIDLVSNDFSSYLFLLDGKNNKITEDEDGGGIARARIIYQAQITAVFRIQASHFDKKNGKYTLTVRRTDGKAVANPEPTKTK